MIAPGRTTFPEARRLVDRLAGAGARIGTDLDAAWSQRLGTYLTGLLPRRPVPGNAHLVKLQCAAEAYFRDRGDGSASERAAALAQAPVMQQADHSFLVLDRETFLNNYLFALAAELAGHDRVMTIQCSTVSCLSRRQPLRGSPFLTWRGTTYDIFGRSKRSYKNCAFALIPGPVTARFTPIEREAAGPEADPFLAPFVGREWPSAPDAFFSMNRDLWRMCRGTLGCDLGIADERLSSWLVALHIEDPESPIHRLVFDTRSRDAFLACKRDLVRSPGNLGVNRAEPDHFWYREPGSSRLRAVLFDPGRLRPSYEKGGGQANYPGDFTAEAVARALRDGSLFPDIVLIFLATCLLPSVDTIGGTSQQDYVDLFRRMLLNCDAAVGLLSEDERRTVQRPFPSRLGGAALVGSGSPLDAVLGSMRPFDDLRPHLPALLDRTVGETVGDLACAYYLADKLPAATE